MQETANDFPTLLSKMLEELDAYPVTGSAGSGEDDLRLVTGHPLCDIGRRVVRAIPDSKDDRHGDPNFPGEGGNLWYRLLRTSRKPEIDQELQEATAAKLSRWLRQHYRAILMDQLHSTNQRVSLPHQATYNYKDVMDVAIIVPLQEEFDELHNQVAEGCQAEKCEETGAYDYRFVRPGTTGSYRCVATFVGDMGETKAGIRTQQLQAKWNARTVVVLGIAAGISKDVMVGDVVVGTLIDSYLQNAKAVDAGSNDYSFEFSGEGYRPSGDLVNQSRHIRYAHRPVFEAWRASGRLRLHDTLSETQFQKLLDNGLVRAEPRVETGHIASGPIIAAASAFIEQVKRKDRKYLALEMESGGVLAAVCDQSNPSCTLVIRGISDLGDGRKDLLDSVGSGALRRYAVQNAIQFLWSLMRCDALPKAVSALSPIAPSQPLEPGFGPPSILSKKRVDPQNPKALIAHPEQPSEHVIHRDDDAQLDRCILISGSGKHIQTNLGWKLFRDFCRALGSRLANTGLTIVVGSTDEPTADRQFLEGANDVGPVGNLRVITRTEEVHNGPTFAELQKILPNLNLSRIQHWNEEWPALRRRQVESSDIVLLVGGTVGTLHIAEAAQQQAKVVIPIGAAGGSAGTVFDWFAPNLKGHGVSDNELEALRNAYDPELVVSLIKRLLETLTH